MAVWLAGLREQYEYTWVVRVKSGKPQDLLAWRQRALINIDLH